MFRSLNWLAVTSAVLLTWIATDSVSAQYSGSQARFLRQATRNYLWNRPTVSPYLNLVGRDGYSGMPNYQRLVLPEIQRRERDASRDRQTARMQTQINQVQTQAARAQSDVANMMLTGRVGWSVRGYPRFGTYLNFYPGFQRLPRR
jgi:hypothetical protein